MGFGKANSLKIGPTLARSARPVSIDCPLDCHGNDMVVTTSDSQATCTDSGICISIGPIPAYFDGIGIGQVHYTGTNSFVCAILTMK